LAKITAILTIPKGYHLTRDFEIVRLTKNHNLSAFDSGDSDLNDFLKNDALLYQEALLSVTYLALNKQNLTIAFFSLSNDSLNDKGYENWNKLNRKIKNSKRRKDYPAVKITRLGIDKIFQGKQLGCQIINFIKDWFTDDYKTGCRFILVDAYNNHTVLKFYEKNNDFNFLTEKDGNEKTRIMFFDLMELI